MKLFHLAKHQTSFFRTMMTGNLFSNYHTVPLIVIIGATGCGKTKLSIELAQRYNGEIISADSIQIYKGLDIATNKATKLERMQVEHHLIDEIDPFQQFTVLDFQKKALESIDSILAKGKLPIIVGGTNYYIESIVWNTLIGSRSNLKNEVNIDNANRTDLESVDDIFKHKITYKNLTMVDDENLYKILLNIDPKSAENLHVHNRRKVIRCLQVYQQTGRTMSEILQEQRSKGSRHGGPLRFVNSIILWVDCEMQNKRLDKRVDEMMEQGLIEELLHFHHNYNNKRFNDNLKADYTEGIFQSIGLKEFHQYLLMNDEQKSTYNGQLALGKGILMLKQRTRSYARKQLKWIRRRFLVDENIRQVPNVYRLDTKDPEQWNEQVKNKAIFIIDNALKAIHCNDEKEVERILTEKLNPFRIKMKLKADDDYFISGQFYCEICNKMISGGNSFKQHLNSKSHQSEFNKNKSK